MAERKTKTNYAEMLGGIRAVHEPNQDKKTIVETENAKGNRGRPAGKRSDPAFKPFTLLLREDTHRSARRKLEDTRSDQDLSDLVEGLLTQWIKS